MGLAGVRVGCFGVGVFGAGDFAAVCGGGAAEVEEDGEGGTVGVDVMVWR